MLHPDFVYVNAEGIRLTRSEYLGFVRDGPLRWLSQTLEDVHVISTGSVAVLTATVRDDLTFGGERHELVFRSTQTYVLEEGTWLYLAGQTSRYEPSS